MIEATKVSFEKCDIDEACSDKRYDYFFMHVITPYITLYRFPIDFTLDFYFDRVEDEELAKIPKHIKEMILSQSAVEYEQSLFGAVLKTDNLEGVSCFAIDQSLHGKHAICDHRNFINLNTNVTLSDVISKARESAQIQRVSIVKRIFLAWY